MSKYITYLFIAVHATICVAAMLCLHQWVVWFYELSRLDGAIITGFILLLWSGLFMLLCYANWELNDRWDINGHG